MCFVFSGVDEIRALLCVDIVNFKILHASAWSRSEGRVPLTLPHQIEEIIPEIEDFYKSLHNGRKLIWQHHLSNGTVR